MTDEEKAIEYCSCNQPICRKGFETNGKQNCTCARKKYYLDGLEEGRKELEKVKTEKYFYKKDTQELEKENEEKEIKISRLKEAIANEHTQFLETRVKLEEQLDFNISLGRENAELNRDKTELVNSVTELKSKVAELEKQIEKMKCCGNCNNFKKDLGLCFYSGGDEDYFCRLRRWESVE